MGRRYGFPPMILFFDFSLVKKWNTHGWPVRAHMISCSSSSSSSLRVGPQPFQEQSDISYMPTTTATTAEVLVYMSSKIEKFQVNSYMDNASKYIHRVSLDVEETHMQSRPCSSDALLWHVVWLRRWTLVLDKKGIYDIAVDFVSFLWHLTKMMRVPMCCHAASSESHQYPQWSPCPPKLPHISCSSYSSLITLSYIYIYML